MYPAMPIVLYDAGSKLSTYFVLGRPRPDSEHFGEWQENGEKPFPVLIDFESAPVIRVVGPDKGYAHEEVELFILLGSKEVPITLS